MALYYYSEIPEIADFIKRKRFYLAHALEVQSLASMNLVDISGTCVEHRSHSGPGKREVQKEREKKQREAGQNRL